MRTALPLLLLCFTAFISLGLPDMVNGTAWPTVRTWFGLPVDRAAELTLTFTVGYLVSSFSAGVMIQRLGVGGVLIASSLMITASLAVTALAPAWWVMVAIGAGSGLGAGGIDSAINGYASGTFSPRVVNWLHACWGIGAAIGSFLMACVLVGGDSWRWGYGILAILLGVMSVGFIATRHLWPATPAQGPVASVAASTTLIELRRPIVWAQLAIFFLYTGFEYTFGQFSVTFLNETRGMPRGRAEYIAAAFLACLTAGRIGFGWLAAHVSAVVLLRLSMLSAIGLTGVVWANFGNSVTFAAICLIGLMLAPVYPLMISITARRVGAAAAARVIGFQVCAATLGINAIFASVMHAGRVWSLEVGPPMLLGVAVMLLIIFEWSERTVKPRSVHAQG